MAKNRKDSGKMTREKTKTFPLNAKNLKQKDAKPKPRTQQQRQNKGADPIRQKKQAENPTPQRRQNKGAELIRQKKEAEKAEKERRILQFKKKRLEKNKVISQKTSRGQPLMKNRIEYLLKQIQEMKKN